MEKLYKRKSFQFCNEPLKSAVRKAEVVKARESSRFKQLSLTRNLIAEEMDSVNSIENISIKKENPRSLMLEKWKQEKQFRREQELKAKKKPFYAGAKNQTASRNMPNKGFQNMSSSIYQSNSRIFNASKIEKSRLVDPKSSTLSSRIPNVSKQVDTKLSSQLSRIPNIPKQETSVPKSSASKLPNKSIPKIPAPSTKQKVLVPQKSHKTPGQSTNQKSATPLSFQKIPAPSTKQERLIPPKSQKMPVQSTNQKSATSLNSQKMHVQSQKYVPCLNSQKIPTSGTKQQPSKAQKTPVQSTSQKSVPCLNSQKGIPTNNVTTRKGYCFKKTVTEARKQQTDFKNVLKENKTNEVEPKQSVLNAPDKFFNLDVSIIKSNNSFAPDDFKFKPPIELSNFMFDDEDPEEILEEIKLKYMGRTSTPTKVSDESPKHSIDSPLKEPSITPLQTRSLKDEKNSSRNSPPSPLMNVKGLSQKEFPKMDIKDLPQKSFNKSEENDIDGSPLLNAKNMPQNEFPIMDTKDSPKMSFNKSGENGIDGSPLVDVKNVSQNEFPILDIKNSPKKLFNTSGGNDIDGSPLVDVIKLSQNEFPIMDIKNSPKKSFNKSGENVTDENLKIASCENKPTDAFEELSACSESPFNILDLNEINEAFEEEVDLLKLQDEIKATDIPEELEKKSAFGTYRRVSVLKSISTLNTITEADDSFTQCFMESSKGNQNGIITPRRSKRLSASSHQKIGILKESIPEGQCLPVTPRRSLRLQKSKLISPVSSPFEQEKSKPKTGPRHSLRLIDLNTPKEDRNAKSNLTADFESLKLNDSENLDPNAFLTNFENSPLSTCSRFKSRKVSLLYTPEINKGARKSIRGDLIAFSPSE